MSHPREESRGRRTSVRQRVSCFVRFFSMDFSSVASTPSIFSYHSPAPALLLCCLLCDEWLHFRLSSLKKKKKKSWNGLQSMQLCRNKTHLTEKEKEIIEEGAAEDGKYRVQLHFTLMQKLSDPSLMKVFWTAGALTKKVLIRALRGQERM